MVFRSIRRVVHKPIAPLPLCLPLEGIVYAAVAVRVHRDNTLVRFGCCSANL